MDMYTSWCSGKDLALVPEVPGSSVGWAIFFLFFCKIYFFLQWVELGCGTWPIGGTSEHNFYMGTQNRLANSFVSITILMLIESHLPWLA